MGRDQGPGTAEKQQAAKGRPAPQGTLSGVPLALPALARAEKISRKAAAVGFDWPDAAEVIAKVREETDEVAQALAEEGPEALAEEIGDLLFSVANLARHAGIDPEEALRRANLKFQRRFSAMEAEVTKDGRPLKDAGLAAMEEAWIAVKRRERVSTAIIGKRGGRAGPSDMTRRVRGASVRRSDGFRRRRAAGLDHRSNVREFLIHEETTSHPRSRVPIPCASDIDQRLAARLAALRQEHGLSLDALASTSGISRATLSRLERAETSPTASLLGRLCTVYGRPMSRLLAEIEADRPGSCATTSRLSGSIPRRGFAAAASRPRRMDSRPNSSSAPCRRGRPSPMPRRRSAASSTTSGCWRAGSTSPSTA